jgi:hypothetical protein
VFLLALLGLVTHRDYNNWTATRPWAFLSHVPDDLPHPLRNKPASIGRKVPDLASLRFDVSLAERDISRLHLLIANTIRRSIREACSSINAKPLRYGDSATLSDGDIVALSGIHAFRYFRIPWQRRHYLSRLLAVGSLDDHLNAVDHARWYGHRGERAPWGALIDGSTKLVHLLSEDAHTVKVSRDGRLTLDATAPQTIASTPDALVMTLNFKRRPGIMPMGCAGLAGGRYLVVEDAREQRFEMGYVFSFRVLEGALSGVIKDDDRNYHRYPLPPRRTIIGMTKDACRLDDEKFFPAYQFIFEGPGEARFQVVALFARVKLEPDRPGLERR